jgi:HK97 family phage major capsid protein/HK97 family phage prohead protease
MKESELEQQRATGEILTRGFSLSAPVERIRAEGENPSDVYRFKLASDKPVEVYPRELEILGHQKGEIRTDFMASGNAPLLWMHDRQQVIGIIDKMEVSNGFTTVEVRFGSSDQAVRVKADVDAGIIKNVSIGYRVHSYQFVEERDGVKTYRASDWEPLEGSFVSIPADKDVGLGRSRSIAETFPQESRAASLSELDNQEPTMQAPAPAPAEAQKPSVEVVSEARADGAKLERERISNIQTTAARTKGYNLEKIAQEAIERGDSVDKFNASVLDHIRENQPNLSQAGIGVSEKEAKLFSLEKVFESVRSGNAKGAEFEREISDALADAQGKKRGSSFVIPIDVLLRGYVPQDAAARVRFGFEGSRTLQSVSLTGGNNTNHVANLVDTELLDELFVYSLRENNALLNMGVTMIGGLRGDAEIPLELLNPQFYWVGEHAAPTEGAYNTGKVDLRFKTLGARVPFTRRAEKQSTPMIEGLLTRSLRIGSGLALERAIYSGAGTSTEPEGILNTAGIGNVVTAGTYSRNALISLRQALGVANAGNTQRALLMSEYAGGQFAKTNVDTGSGRFVANYNDDNASMQTEIGRAVLTNLLPNNTVLYGDPSSVYVGMWGTMEVDIDDTTDRNVGGKTVRVWLDADTAIPQPAKWSAIRDLAIV